MVRLDDVEGASDVVLGDLAAVLHHRPEARLVSASSMNTTQNRGGTAGNRRVS